jgi:thiamine kinase-like enzyme
MTEFVEQLIGKLWSGRDVQVEPLPGGHTNANYLITLDDGQVVLRIPGENTSLLGIDRECEYQASSLAASIGVAPDVLAHSKDDGWLVTRFLPGTSLTRNDLSSEPRLSDVAITMKQLHVAGSIDTVFNPFHVVRNYHELVRTRDVDEPFDYDVALARLDRIEAVRAFHPTAFCHNDLLNTNFVFDGKLRVFDWEYAGMGDPFFDLANFSANNDLSPEADTALLDAYFGHADPSQQAVLALMKVVSELRETMWNLVQLFVSTLDFDYAAFARERVRRYQTLMDQMDFEETLTSASTLRRGDLN